MTVSISRFLSHTELLGRDFAAPSWDAWKVVLKAALGEPLTAAETERFRELAGREPPGKRVSELWIAAGRRSGKDSAISAVATYLAVHGNWGEHLRRGEPAQIACIACDRAQAGIVHSYIAAYFREIEALKPLLISDRDDTVVLANNVEITIATNTYRGVRGRTTACAIFDEAAFYRDDASANSDVALYNAIRPSTITLPGAMIVGISSVHRAAGLLYERVNHYLGRDDPAGLSLLLPSTALNPTLATDPAAQDMIARAFAEDPEAAAAEWESKWRSDLVDFLDAATVDAAIDAGRAASFPSGKHTYVVGADQSGGRRDSFTAAVGHLEGETIVIDKVLEYAPPFDVDDAMDGVADLARFYGSYKIHHDAYGADLIRAGWRLRGVTGADIAVRRDNADHNLNRSEVYLGALPAFTSGRVRLPDDRRLRHQLISLERRAVASGRDTIDHPRGGHDDVANAVCIVVALLAAKRPGLRVTREHVRRASLPPGAIITYPTDAAPVCTTPEWHAADPMTRMTMSAIEQQQRREPPPEKRTSLYISGNVLNRARAPGAWTDRAGHAPGDPYATAAAAWPVGGIDMTAGRNR